MALRKTEYIQIRLTLKQKKKLDEYARKVGMGTSTWLLAVGLQAAAK